MDPKKSGIHTVVQVPSSRKYPATGMTVAVLVTTALLVLTQLYSSIPLLPAVSETFHTDATYVLSVSFSFAYAIGFLIWGPISDHYGRVKVVCIALLVLIFTTAGCAFATSAGLLTVLRACQGLAAAGFAPVALAYMTEAVPPEHRARAIGAISTAFLAAGILGQVVASAIVLSVGWQWFFGICSLLLMGAFALTLLTMSEQPHSTPCASLRTQFATLGVLFIKPAFLLLGLAHLTLLLSFVALYTGLGRHLNTLGVSESAIILVRLAAFPSMFVSLAAGALARKYGVLRVAQIGFGISLAGLLSEFLSTNVLVGIILTSLVYVAGVALAIPSMITLYGGAAAPHRASGMAINGFVLFVGASAGPLIGALPVSFSILTLLLTGLMVVASCALLAISSLALFKQAA